MSAKFFMQEAINQAKLAININEIPVGAVIVKDNKIISKAHNMRETNNNSLHHAEILAIDKACKHLNNWRLDNCDIYVTLEPCLMCTGAIIQARLKNVYFGAFDNDTLSLTNIIEFSKPIKTSNPTVYAGFMEDECSSIIRDFFDKIRL